MANEVKFLRGTIDQFNAATKNADTLYFVTDGGKLRLFLGSKEVADLTTYALTSYVDSEIAKVESNIGAVDAMRFVGSVATAADLKAKEATAKNGDTYKATASFTITGADTKVETGDILIARVESKVFQSWVVVQANIDGAVTAVEALTTDSLVVGNGSKSVKASDVTIDKVKSSIAVTDKLTNADTLAQITEVPQTKAEIDKAIKDADDAVKTEITTAYEAADTALDAKITEAKTAADNAVLRWETLPTV